MGRVSKDPEKKPVEPDLAVYSGRLAARISFFIGKSGLTQKEIGKKLGKSQRTISNWMLGVSVFPMDLAPKIAELFGITIREIFPEK